MTLKDVKVKSIDDKSIYFHPTRTVEIKTSEGRILTPTRAATLYEFNQKITIPAITPIENPISFSVKKMNKSKLEKFLKENGLYKNWYRRLIDSEDMMKYSLIRAHIFQPTTSTIIIKNKNGSKTKIPSGVEYLSDNPKLRDRFLRLIIKMQVDADLDTISIPFLNFPFSEYKKFVSTLTKEIRALNKEPLFAFDLNYQNRGDRFEDAMSYFIKNIDLKLLAFPNRSFSAAPISYDILSTQFTYSDVAFLTFEVDRSDRVNNQISKMHYFPFVGNDVYSVKTPRFVPNPDKPKEDPSLSKIKFFNPKNLLIESSGTRLNNPRKILDEINERGDKWLTTILDNTKSIGSDFDKIAVINAISKIHELKSSTGEFTSLQKIVSSRESTEYIKEKPYLESTLTTLRKKKRKSKN